MALFGQQDPRNLVAQQFFAPSADTKSPLIAALTGAIQQGRTDAATRDKQQLFAQGAQAAFSGNQTPAQAAALFAADPERATKLLESAGAFEEKGRTRLAQTAFKIMNLQDPNQRNAALREVASKMQAGGADPSVFAGLIGKSSQEQNQALQVIQDATLSVQQRSAQDLSERKFGLEQQRTNATVRNANSMIADRQRTQARLAQKATDAANAGVQIDAKGRRSINSDVTGLLKETVGIASAASSLAGLEKVGSAAARLAAVFKFMKALDPTSVVRETEQGQVYAASGAASQLAGQLNSVLGKGKLTDAGFRDLVLTSNNMANSSIGSASDQVGSYLSTYEDTIPNSFKTRLTGRIPDLFPSQSQQQSAPNQSGSASVSAAPAAAPANVSRFKIEVLN